LAAAVVAGLLDEGGGGLEGGAVFREARAEREGVKMGK